MWYVRVAVAEDWLRRSPYASTVLEQVRDGIRLKRGFGCGSAMSIKQVCCHCTRLSLSLAVAEDWLRRSPYASTVLEQVRDGIRLKRGFGGVSAEPIEQARLLCARLSLSLAVAEDRRRLGRANRASSFALRSTFAIFAGCAVKGRDFSPRSASDRQRAP